MAKTRDKKISDKEPLQLSQNLSSLTRLHLERTEVTDKGIAAIKSLSQLQYINRLGRV
jgi:hypothetical protein